MSERLINIKISKWIQYLILNLVAIAGVILIARPPFIFGGHDYDENTLVGLIMAFVCSFAIGGIYICLRRGLF